jgi:hypothetical protein
MPWKAVVVVETSALSAPAPGRRDVLTPASLRYASQSRVHVSAFGTARMRR